MCTDSGGDVEPEAEQQNGERNAAERQPRDNLPHRFVGFLLLLTYEIAV